MLEEKLDVLVVADVIDEDTKKYIFPYMQTGGFHEKIWSNF